MFRRTPVDHTRSDAREHGAARNGHGGRGAPSGDAGASRTVAPPGASVRPGEASAAPSAAGGGRARPVYSPPAPETADTMETTARPPDRLVRDRSLLLVVDIQERLAPAIAEAEAVIARTSALMRLAGRFGIPTLATEHLPERIGPLVATVRDSLVSDAVLVKQRFGAADEPAFGRWLGSRGRDQIVIAGMEAHVCVLQTALALVAGGYRVFVAADATGSRSLRSDDRDWALARMRDAGCTIAGTETILFEWTGGADDPAFRETLAIVKSLP